MDIALIFMSLDVMLVTIIVIYFSKNTFLRISTVFDKTKVKPRKSKLFVKNYKNVVGNYWANKGTIDLASPNTFLPPISEGCGLQSIRTIHRIFHLSLFSFNWYTATSLYVLTNYWIFWVKLESYQKLLI